MHEYELKIMDFMKTVGKTSVKIDDLLLKPAQADVEHYLRKMYEDEPNRPFSIRMSNIGRPICQLQMEQSGAARVDDDWNYPLRMMYGAIVEGLTVSIIKHSGIKIDEEQTQVKLPVLDRAINGTLDIVLDGKVWDIKSASPHSFKEKFASYETLKGHDTFGYLPQLYGYAKARNVKPGGWIVVDKSSGELKVIEVSSTWEEDQNSALLIIEENVRILTSKAPFKRCFEDKIETFRKRPTGNKILDYPCNFCSYRYSCWPDLKHIPSVLSTAYDKAYKYYTELNNENTVR